MISFVDYLKNPLPELTDLESLLTEEEKHDQNDVSAFVCLENANWEILFSNGRYLSDVITFGARVSCRQGPNLQLSGLTSQSGVEDVETLLKSLNVEYKRSSSVISRSTSLHAGVRTFSFAHDGTLESVGSAAR